MQIINVPAEYQLMSPLEQFESLGLTTPTVKINNQSNFKYLLIGSLITISIVLIVVAIKIEIDKKYNKI